MAILGFTPSMVSKIKKEISNAIIEKVESIPIFSSQASLVLDIPTSSKYAKFILPCIEMDAGLFIFTVDNGLGTFGTTLVGNRQLLSYGTVTNTAQSGTSVNSAEGINITICSMEIEMIRSTYDSVVIKISYVYGSNASKQEFVLKSASATTSKIKITPQNGTLSLSSSGIKKYY